MKTILSLLLLCATAAHAQKMGVTGPHLLVYKTRANYNNHVAITLSPDKKAIASYPDPHDIKALGKKAAPTPLHQGYLLDNRGISPQTAFLKTTYTAYAQLPQAPTEAQLNKMITTRDPLTTLCDCGPKTNYKNPITELNKLIDSKQLLKKCKEIKGR